MTAARPRTFHLQPADLAQSALQAQLLARCRRALDHDMKNAVQVLHAGVELLSKSLQAPAGRRISPQECIPLLQQQLTGLQQTLGRLLDEIAPQPAPPAAFDVARLLRELLQFLDHEPAIAEAKLLFPAQALAFGRVAVVRRALLSCILDAIDIAGAAGSLELVITQMQRKTPPCLEVQLRVIAPPNAQLGAQTDLQDSAAMLTSRQLSEILASSLAGENASIAFAPAGQGYSFTIELPVPAATNMERADALAPVSPTTTTTRVLVIDGHRDAADSLALLLELEGFDTRAVYSGADALPLIEEYRPALILLDTRLNDHEGPALARRIRESSRHRPVLIAVSEYAGRHEAGAMSDFDAELPKPVELPALLELIAVASSDGGDDRRKSRGTV